MENVKNNPTQKQINNNYLKENKQVDEFEEDGGVGSVEDEAIMMMNNKFFNDDIYNYKDTFLSGRSINKSNSNHYEPSKSNNTSNSTKNFAYEDEDYDLNDDEEDDENNDFTTGPLAKKSSNYVNEVQYNNQFDEIGENMESLKFQNELAGEAYDDFNEDGQQPTYFNKIYEDEEPENDMMIDTFFKRVDSLDMVKPKKVKIIKNYLIGELLGDGSYGKVKECLDMNSLSRRAVKIINLKMVARKIPRGVENVRKEISIMKNLNHKNVIKLYDTFEKGTNSSNNNNRKSPINEKKDEDTTADELLAQSAAMVNLEKPPKIYIFMDYCMTSLEKVLKTAPDQRLGNWQANFYFKQLIDGLEYLHSLNIIHNDIKPGNLLITCDDTLKLCDFSISAKLSIFCEEEYKALISKKNDNLHEDDEEYNDGINPNLLSNNSSSPRFPIIQCTPMFQCPEMLDEDVDELLVLRNASKIDIWSSGIALYQLTTGDLPFQGQTIHQIFENIRSPTCLVKIPAFIDKNLNKLLMGMLDKDPISRWSIKQIRDCEWFKKKHPVIKEDLARIPSDVVNNECSTSFRMISYLEKYCEALQEYQQQSAQQSNAQTIQSQYENSTNRSNNLTNIENKNQSVDSQLFALNNKNKMQQQNGNTLASQQSSTQYSQATKIKKNHCRIM